MDERTRIEEEELKKIAEKFPGQHLGSFELKDGKLSPEQEAHLRQSFSDLITKIEPNEARRKEAFERLEQTLKEVQDTGGLRWQLSINLAKAKYALERMEAGLLNLSEAYAQTIDQGYKVFQLGQVHGLLSSGLSSVAGALDRLDHALNCDCGGKAHSDEPEPEASERPTDPPPAETAAPAEQEADA